MGLNENDVKMTTKYNIEFIGTSGKIIAQIPEAGSDIIEGGNVILYLENYYESE